ncbi:hypothetical protein WOLCODRAFT_126908, partial [Wolfiporia cocos MD-104 SS10]
MSGMGQVARADASYFLEGSYFYVALEVVLCYDYLLTFTQEVEHVWHQRVTGANIIFMVNRYASLIFINIPQLQSHCPGINLVRGVMFSW